MDHFDVVDTRLVEDLSNCGKTKPLVKRLGMKLGIQHHRRGADLIHYLPHKHPANAEPSILLEHRDAFNLGFPGFQRPHSGCADPELFDARQKMPAGFIQPVEFFHPGNTLLVAKHDPADFKGSR